MGSTATPSSISPWTTTTQTTQRIVIPAYQKSKRRPLKTPAPSPSSFKDTLKQNCLERVRRNKRHEALWRHRLSPPNTTARDLVHEELRECGVSVQQGAVFLEGTAAGTRDSAMMIDEATRKGDEYAISESELYELMQEVEEELQRNVETRLHEEMEQVELCDQLNRQHLETQIAEYQDWEDEQASNDVVLCPVCNEANLLQLTNGGVACPNSMNDSCPLRIQQPIVLSNLKKRLGTAHEMHACTCCSPLEFHVRGSGDNVHSSLVATCNTCESNVCIL